MDTNRIHISCGCGLLLLAILMVALLGSFLFFVSMNPLFNFFDLFRVPNFQEHKWTVMKIEYYVLSEENYVKLESETRSRLGNDLDLRERKHFTIDNPQDTRKAMGLLRPKDWWPMSIGVARETEVHDESGNIWDMSIRSCRIYILKRGTTASYGFEVDNDFVYYIRNLAFEHEKKTNPNAKLEHIGLPFFNVCELNFYSRKRK